MGKEWVPPGENVGNVSICYFWLARGCRCLHNKNILAMSARLLEKSWHHLEHWIYSVAKTHKERRVTKAIAKAQLRGRAPKLHKVGIMGDPCFTFLYLCWMVSCFSPLQIHSSPISTLPCVPGDWPLGTTLNYFLVLWLLVGFNQGKTPAGDQRVGGEWNWGIYSRNSLFVSRGWDGRCPSTSSVGSSLLYL